MSLHKAVSIVYQVMDEMGLTKLEKGRILSEIGQPNASPRAVQVWGMAQKRMGAKGIAVAAPVDDK